MKGNKKNGQEVLGVTQEMKDHLSERFSDITDIIDATISGMVRTERTWKEPQLAALLNLTEINSGITHLMFGALNGLYTQQLTIATLAALRGQLDRTEQAVNACKNDRLGDGLHAVYEIEMLAVAEAHELIGISTAPAGPAWDRRRDLLRHLQKVYEKSTGRGTP
jgi:hypothetical protein